MSQQYPQVQKKKHTARTVFIILGLLAVVGIGGCVAFAGAVGSEMDKQVKAEDDRNAPREVRVGVAFFVGKHETQTGWKVQPSGYAFTVVGKVKNVSDSTSTAFIHFKFLDAKGEVLGNVSCNSADLEPGQTQALNCIPDGTFTRKYAKVTAEATF